MSGQGAPQRWDVEPFTELKTTVGHVGEPLDTVPAVASAAAPRCVSSATSLFFRSWHGAAQTRFMPHLAMLEVDDEGNGDHVRDEEYEAAPRIDNGQPTRASNEGWSLYGAPWLQLLAIDGKSHERGSADKEPNRCRRLHLVAANSAW